MVTINGQRRRRWFKRVSASLGKAAAASPSRSVPKRPAWHRRVPAAVTILAGVLTAGWTQPALASDLLPNLVADPPARAYLSSELGQLLLRFDGFVHNVGPGPFEVLGQRASPADPMIAYQQIYRTDGSSYVVKMPGVPGAQLMYVGDDGHRHWHLQRIAAFSLWNRRRTKLVAPSVKVGFCLADHEHIDLGIGPAVPFYNDAHGRAFCQKNNPAALSLFEGVSVGWRDLYERSLLFQWVDVSETKPGVYWLREDINPTHMVREANPFKVPAYAAAPTTIPGYNARSLRLGSVNSRFRTVIRLGADRYGPTAPVRYRVIKAPAHGTLNVRAGSLFSGPMITYLPRRGYHGRDQFTYVARDPASRYPYHPTEATVSLTVGPIPRGQRR